MIITVNIQIFIIVIILILTNQIKIYTALMIFALIHELAHMFTGIALKLKPKELKINPLGISIQFEAYEQSEKKNMLVAISGPLLNIIIAIICAFLNIPQETKELIIYSNILLGIFNLLPIYPLDGGRLLKAVLRNKYNFRETDKITNQITNIIVIGLTAVSSIIVLIYHNIGLLLLLLYIWILNIKENKKYILKTRVYNAIYSKDIDKNS